MKYNINHWVKAAAISLLTSTAFCWEYWTIHISATIKAREYNTGRVMCRKMAISMLLHLQDSNGKTSINTSFANKSGCTANYQKNGYSNLVRKCPV